MSNHLVVKITVPVEYDTKNADGGRVYDTIARIFPHDPRLEGARNAGATVNIEVEKAPAPKPQTPADTKEAKKDGSKAEDTPVTELD